MTKIFKVCFIGAGNMGEEHIKVFNKNKKTKVVGIYSRSKRKCFPLAKKYNIPLIADSIDELYFKTQADLVVIAVSETSTKQICKKCFKYKWKCLVEKPIGINLKDQYLYDNYLNLVKSSDNISQNTIFNSLEYLIINENDLFAYNLDKKLFLLNFFAQVDN